MTVEQFDQALKIAARHRGTRSYPDQDDKRCRNGTHLFPSFKPKFQLPLTSGVSVLTIGSCFARNVEEALVPLGVHLPTRSFSVPASEWPARANGLLNEYNPGTMCQRILDAIDGVHSAEATIVQQGGGYTDLLLPTVANDITFERAVERRAEIFDIYSYLPKSSVVIMTLGLIESWFDKQTNQFLNRMPPAPYAKSHPGRFVFRQLDCGEIVEMLDKAMSALAKLAIKVVITVSPVPLRVTFTEDDCVIANEYSKAALRVCAEIITNRFDHVDYFPSFEIVRSGGLNSYSEDNVHVKSALVNEVTSYMVKSYAQPPAS